MHSSGVPYVTGFLIRSTHRLLSNVDLLLLQMEGIPENEYKATVSFLWSAVAFFCWTTLYSTLCVLNPRRSYEWHCRIVTVIHGITVTAMSAWCGFIQGPWPFTHPGLSEKSPILM